MSGGLSSSNSQATSTPVNLQNPAFTALAPGVSSQLSSIFNSNPYGIPSGGGGGTFSPFMVNGVPSNNTAQNPLVAGLTGNQNSLLASIFGGSGANGFGGVTPQSSGQDMSQFLNGGNFGNLQNSSALIRSFMDPNFATNLAQSSQTKGAISSALSPLEQSFRSTTAPGLTGAATGAGQRTGGAGQAGSSAFDQAFSNAQGNLMATEAATAGQIANSAYQTGLQINAQAPGMAAATSGAELGQRIQAQNQPVNIGTTELNNMIQSLQAEVLPQLTQQYGINAGLQLFNTQIQTMLQALGYGVQAAQPAIAEQGKSSGSSFGIGGSAFNPYGGKSG